MEAIYQDRVQFAQLVRDVATTDVCRMGIEILSFTIKDVYDDVDYLTSLGRTQTAIVKKEASIGVAQAERDAGIRVSALSSGFEEFLDDILTFLDYRKPNVKKKKLTRLSRLTLKLLTPKGNTK